MGRIGPFESRGTAWGAVLMPAGSGATGIAAVANRGRLGLGLMLPVRARPVDVSIQPGVVDATAADTARRGETDPNAATVAVARWIVGRARHAGHDAALDDRDLVAAAGAAAFPLVAQAYAAGAAPVREIPRFATAVLAAPSAREGARVAFGAAATRPVVAALAAGLVPREQGPVRFGPLGLGLLGAGILEPDQVARVLSTAADGPVEGNPTPDSLAAVHRALAELGARATLGLLLDAATRPDGLTHLAIAVVAHRSAAPHEGRIPSRLDAFTTARVARMALDPAPEPVEQPAGEPPARLIGAADAPVPDAPVPDAPVPDAPVRPATGPPRRRRRSTPAPPPASVHGRSVGDLRLVEPRSTRELAHWGTLLHNCLADYQQALTEGRSRLIGVERDGRLRYCLELTADGRLRQFLAERNRQVPEADREAVLTELLRTGLLARMTTPGRRALAAPRGSASQRARTGG